MRKPWRALSTSFLLLLASLSQAAQYRVPTRVTGSIIAAPIILGGTSLASPLSLTPLTLAPQSQTPLPLVGILTPSVSLITPAPAPAPVVPAGSTQLDSNGQVVAVPGSALSVTAGVHEAFKTNASPSDILSSLYDGQLRTSAVSVAPVPVQLPGGNLLGRPEPQRQYLTQAEGKAGKALLDELHAMTGRNFSQHEYGEAKSYMFATVDNVQVDGKHGIIDAYSGIFVEGHGGNGGDYPERGDQNHDGYNDKDGMNVEHTWPQSFFDKRLPMKSDLHHLMSTFIHPNGVRGNLPFGEVKGQGDYKNDAGAKRGQGVFEPPDFAKGKVARAVLYFYTRYLDRNITNGAYNDQTYWNGKLEMFLRWNKQFPPDEMEHRRNDLVEKFQGNRNPFIDDPTLADKIGIEGFKRGLKLDRLQFRQSSDQPVSQRKHRRR